MKKPLSIRERIYLEEIKKAAKVSIETKLRNTLQLSDFCRYLREMVIKSQNK